MAREQLQATGAHNCDVEYCISMLRAAVAASVCALFMALEKLDSGSKRPAASLWDERILKDIVSGTNMYQGAAYMCDIVGDGPLKPVRWASNRGSVKKRQCILSIFFT